MGADCEVAHAEIKGNFSLHLTSNHIKKQVNLFMLLLTRCTAIFVNFVIFTSLVKIYKCC